MNIQKLKEVLEKKNIPSHYYSLDGGLPNDAWCLRKSAVRWEVYYSERGKKYSVKEFTSEEEACNYLYNKLSNFD
ncbi:hypothetical protein [Pseudalkalibacillus sp. SCS-8]|uniref:hypothetical protein n=1 Tax=Pseudalkalibacillus nanhaiensis TaxID=3115291 RepID=UPI0032D9E935